MNQTDYPFSCIGNRPTRTIINNRGKSSFTVKRFKEIVDLFSRAFAAQGLAVGDVICTISLTTPEMYAIKYAATSLGFISCNLNVLDAGLVDSGLNRLYRQIKNVNPKMVFVLDILEDRVSEVLNLPEFSNIKKISLSLNASIPRISAESIAVSFLKTKLRLTGKGVFGIQPLSSFLTAGRRITDIPSSMYIMI